MKGTANIQISTRNQGIIKFRIEQTDVDQFLVLRLNPNRIGEIITEATSFGEAWDEINTYLFKNEIELY